MKIKNMKKEYVLVEVGGMNSECILGVNRFDNMDEVFDYCNENEILDINGVRFRNSYVDEEVDKGGGWMSDEFMCDCYDDVLDKDTYHNHKILRVYGIDEGLELLEIEKKA
jgi:hypothetical protein